MLAGPIFGREALISPRPFRHYLVRAGYLAALGVLMWTAGQVTFGFQQVRNVGDIARFGAFVFQIFSMVQLSLVLFFALLFSAGNVAQEKDRQTLILVLLTDLRDREVVFGKLFASLLMVGVLLAASLPAFAFVHLMGGVDLAQIGWSLGLCMATALAAGSWGNLVAFWREKTFQTLAISVLGLVLFLGGVEALVALSGIDSAFGSKMALLNPYRALLFGVLDPLGRGAGGENLAFIAGGSVVSLLLLSGLLNLGTIYWLRVWNPSRVMHVAPQTAMDAAGTERNRSVLAKQREVWNNPVVWREFRTRAYGRKIFVIKIAYFVIALFAFLNLMGIAGDGELIMGMITPLAFTYLTLCLLSLMLINAQAVTSITTERDGKTLELLLVTDVTAKEFIYGKLGGVFYNTKELILIPLLLVGYYMITGSLSLEDSIYLVCGFVVLAMFSGMLGLHAGLSFESSRAAIANSLGTMFFLFIGIFILLILLVEARSSFILQFHSFFIFIVVGSIGLWCSLTQKNPSPAFVIAAGILPFFTFYSITQFLLGGSLGVLLAIAFAYGFTTLAMLVPAVSEFDVALGRTTLDKA